MQDTLESAADRLIREPGVKAPVGYEGRAWPLFWLAAKTLVLTILTLGIYRFWMKTRLRRYYWSSICISNEPLEYTGRAVELLLGFLLAVVFLAIYLGFFNLVLTFVGMSFFEGHPAALNLSILALAPIIFYAQYRARRYLLSRTRWRGIRFGAEKGAVSYAWRACLYGLASVASLGLLVPWMQYQLAKFSMDRTWFGDLRFMQGGSWTGLLRYWLWAFLPVLLGGAVLAAMIGNATNWFQQDLPEEPDLRIVGIFVLLSVIWIASSIYYNARSFQYLNNHRTLGAAVSFNSDLQARKVFGVYLVAIIGFGIGSIVISLLVFAVVMAVVGLSSGMNLEFDSVFAGLVDGEAVGYAIMIPFVAIYLLMFAMFSALNHVLLTQPMLRLFAKSITVAGVDALNLAQQREGEDLAEAEGFADALDVGAAF